MCQESNIRLIRIFSTNLQRNDQRLQNKQEKRQQSAEIVTQLKVKQAMSKAKQTQMELDSTKRKAEDKAESSKSQIDKYFKQIQKIKSLPALKKSTHAKTLMQEENEKQSS